MEVELQQFVAQLVNLSNPERIEEANKYVTELIQNEMEKALQMSVVVVLTDGIPPVAVKQALNILRIVFTPKYSLQLSALKQKWIHFTDETRTQIKQAIIRGLFFEDPSTRGLAAVDLMLLAQLDWSRAEEELIVGALAGPFSDTENYNDVCRIGCCQALQELVQNKFITSSSSIAVERAPIYMGFLTRYIEGLNGENSVELLRIFLTLFPVFGDVFRDFENRGNLIRMIASKLSVPRYHLHVVVYQVLLEIVRHFYGDSCVEGNPVMELIFAITIASLKSNDPELVEPSLTFWMHLARFERKILRGQTQEYLGLAEKALEQLLPVFFTCIQNTPFDEPPLDDFNSIDVSVLGEQCLKAFSAVAPVPVAKAIVETAPGLLKSSEWKQRAGGLIAFWCLVDIPNIEFGRQIFVTNFTQFLPFLADSSPVVCDNALCLLRDLLITYPEVAYDSSSVNELLNAINTITTSNLTVLCRVMTLFSAYAKVSLSNMEKSTLRNYPDMPIYNAIMEVLLSKLEYSESAEYHVITHVAGAVVDVIAATPESLEVVMGLVDKMKMFLDRIQALGGSLATEMNRDLVIRNMKTYCVILYSIIVRLGTMIDTIGSAPVATIDVLLKCLVIQDESLFEEALTTAVVLIEKAPNQLSSYIPAVMKHIIFALSQPSPVMVEASAVCLYGLLKQFTTEMRQYHKDLFQHFMALVENDRVPNRTRGPIIHTMSVILLESNPVDTEMLEAFYTKLNAISQLPANTQSRGVDKEAVASFYDAMVHGYYAVMKKSHESNAQQQFRARYRSVAVFFDRISSDPSVFSADLVEHIVAYLNEMIDLEFGRLLNVFIKRKSIYAILSSAICEFHSTKAEFVQKRINGL